MQYEQIANDCFERILKAWREVNEDEQDDVLRRMHAHKLWGEYWRLEIELLECGNASDFARHALTCDRAAWLFCKIVRDATPEPELDLFSL